MAVRVLKLILLIIFILPTLRCTNGLLQIGTLNTLRYPIDFYSNNLVSPSPGAMGMYLAFADFQNNGSIDFVLPNGTSATVYGNNGVGGFSFFAAPAMAGTGRGAAAADFDSDGYIDFAAVDNANSQVQFYKNNSGSAFFVATNYTLGGGANAIDMQTGDVDQDGDKDLVVAKYGTSNVCVLTNSGVGSFSACSTYAASMSPSKIQLTDLNNDGDLDIITVGSSALVGTYLGGGGASFSAEAIAPIANPGQSIAVWDFDFDGKKDVLVSHGAGSAGVQFLKGNGDGTFQPASSVGLGPGPNNYLAAGDLNGDGFSDFVLVNDAMASTVYVYQGNGNGTFAGPIAFSNTGCTMANNIFLKDLNNDNRLDIISVCRSGNQISVMLHK